MGEELLNVYDGSGAVVGARPRRAAKASGLAVGAIHILAVNSDGRVLLQRRRDDKENGGLWDKSVGGHVSAGEDFDATAVRECGEELFGDGASERVHLVPEGEAFRTRAHSGLPSDLAFFRRSLQLNLRDVRRRSGGGLRNVVYHVGTYLGRTDVPLEAFTPQLEEIRELGYFLPGDIDQMLVDGKLAPNMGFLWLTHAHELLRLPGVREFG
jgi:8-oxo-dGTP pyrophosphatase MutT (NUDIX family)